LTESGDGALDAIVALIRSAPPRAGRTRVLALDGRSGSGKTALAARLATRLGAEMATGFGAQPTAGPGTEPAGPIVPVVAMDDLYGGWDGLDRGIRLLVSDVLEPLAAGRPALVPRYDWMAGAWGRPARLRPPGILIVEGVGTGSREAARYESAVVWLEAPLYVRKNRALRRDGPAFAAHWDEWAGEEDAMLTLERTPLRADLVIDTGGTLGRWRAD
jgi:hypothetical protein